MVAIPLLITMLFRALFITHLIKKLYILEGALYIANDKAVKESELVSPEIVEMTKHHKSEIQNSLINMLIVYYIMLGCSIFYAFNY